MKKVLIIIIVFISIALIGTGFYLSTTPTPKEEKKQEEKESEKEPEKEKVEYTDPTTPTKEFSSITTPDNEITLSNITVFYRDGVSAFEVDVTSKKDMSELFLLIEFNLETENTQKTIILTDLKANKKVKTQIQVEKDLTKAISWSAKQLTKEEAKTNIKYSRSVQ